MKHIILYAGVALVVYTLYKKQQTGLGVGGGGMQAPMPVTVSPGTLASSGADTSCSSGCNSSPSLPQNSSPDAVTHDVERADYDSINPFSVSAI